MLSNLLSSILLTTMIGIGIYGVLAKSWGAMLLMLFLLVYGIAICMSILLGN